MLALGCLVAIYIAGTSIIMGGLFPNDQVSTSTQSTTTKEEERQMRAERVNRPNRPESVQVVLDESTWQKKPSLDQKGDAPCTYKLVKDLPHHERFPQKGERHMIDPPSGGKVSLVCCDTTAGPLNILAHHKWAPFGAERFMAMVTSGYFNTGVPFMRCIEGFLCQFGLNADNSKSDAYRQSIEDDPNWLPEGPAGRQNEKGVKRFAQGYLAYAGAGKHTRSKQLIIALKANGPLAGGSPWEVPWGEIVHQESFDTLNKIYTGYGEDGPPQGQVGPKGMTEAMRAKWPHLDYINSCRLMDEIILPDLVPAAPKQ